MAAQDGFVGANPASGSLIERIRMSKETLWRRLMIWIAAVIVTSIAVEYFLPRDMHIPNAALLASVYVVAACAGLGASVYCFVIFALGRWSRSLLAAMAFAALGCGAIFQAIADLRSSTPANYTWLTTCSWTVAALLFVGQAYSRSRWKWTSRRRAIAEFIAAVAAVAVFPLALLPYAIDPHLLAGLETTVTDTRICDLVHSAMNVCTLGLLSFAIIGYYRRYAQDNDRMSGLMCYFMAACGPALAFDLMSVMRFDRWYTVGVISQMTAWIVLVVGSGVENAFVHNEGNDRLAELETLHDVSWSLVGAGTVRELLDLFVCTLVDKLGARISAVYLADGDGSLEASAICGADDSVVGTKYPLSGTGFGPGFHTGHTAKAFFAKEVQVRSDVFVDVEFVPWRVIAGDDGCAASIPFVHGENSIGVMNVYFSDRRQLTPRRLRLLTTIAAAATSAIEYALSKESADRIDDGELDLAA